MSERDPIFRLGIITYTPLDFSDFFAQRAQALLSASKPKEAHPSANIYFSFLASGALSFIIGMIFQLVEDLDNPFVGHWNITPEPFERVLKHIKSY